MPLILECEHCNKGFKVSPSRKGTAKFCSVKCHDDFRSMKVTVKCENCAKPFFAKKSRAEKQNPRYCSVGCRKEAFNGENSPLFTRHPRICKHCGEEFLARKSEIDAGKASFCSKGCKYEYQKCDEPQNNAHFYTLSFWHNLRKECFKRDRYACQKCGTTERILHAHHVVPRRVGGKDELENLLSLCNSCHIKVEHELIKNEKAQREEVTNDKGKYRNSRTKGTSGIGSRYGSATCQSRKNT